MAQHVAKCGLDVRVVVDDEDACHARAVLGFWCPNSQYAEGYNVGMPNGMAALTTPRRE
jgi:hypothetical protein